VVVYVRFFNYSFCTAVLVVVSKPVGDDDLFEKHQKVYDEAMGGV
jgi:hypothetical protein